MPNVLIVDDTKFLRETLKEIFIKAGFVVIGEADNGVKAVLMYKELRPDLVTMDITMPEMNGIEAVKRIKEFDSSAKIIMCSAMGQQKMVVEAIESGAKDFITKPFDEARVLEAVKHVLQ
ncbi:response regulator [Bacillus kexueae]|uniref:response regulator n=1 Tax=Aeribacillus kexueae TaxID=2078952 RepID=UPI001FB03FA8